MAGRTITIYLPDEDIRHCETRGKDAGLSVSGFLRSLVVKHRGECAQTASLANRMGVKMPAPPPLTRTQEAIEAEAAEALSRRSLGSFDPDEDGGPQ